MFDSLGRLLLSNCLTVILISSALSCATPYQPVAYTGGYSELKLDEDVYSVRFSGNGYTSRDRVETFLLRRCAELTLAKGYHYFKFLSNNSDERTQTYTTPGEYSSNTNINGNINSFGSSSTFSGNAQTQGNYSPPQTYVITKHGASATIKLLMERPSGEQVFDANIIMSNFQ